MADFGAFPHLTAEQRARLAHLGIDGEQSFAEWMLTLSPTWARKHGASQSGKPTLRDPRKSAVRETAPASETADRWLAILVELSRRPPPVTIPMAVVMPAGA